MTTSSPRRAAEASPAASPAPPGRLVSPERGRPGTPSAAGKAPARPAALPADPPGAPVAGALATPDPAREAPSAAPSLSRVRSQVPARGAPDADNAPRAGSSEAPPWWPQPPAVQDIYVRLTLNLEPVPKERHRTSAAEYTQAGGQRVKTKAAHSYTTKRLAVYEETVGWLLQQARVVRNDTDDLGVHAVFHVRGNQPDLDNLVKSLFDACNGVAWHDDKQVTCLTTGLVRGSDRPRTELVIYVAALAGLNAGTT